MSETINSGTGNTRDTRLLERAVKKRWPIPEQYKEAIMRRQALIAIDPKAKPREASAAARTLIAADKLNLEEEQGKETQQHLHLHQETQVNLDNLSIEQLEKLEQLLIDAQTGNSKSSEGTSEARTIEPVSVCEVGVGAD